MGIEAAGERPTGAPAGIGCRGPDKIWPGRGAGTGRAGMGPVRNGGCSGAVPPAAKGGLKGAGLLRSGSSTMETVASSDVAGGSMLGAAGLAATAAGGRSATDSGRAGSSIASRSATATELSDARCVAAPAPPCKRCRTISATGSSMELEWVFFSETPSSGNMSIMACDGTSSCLASSLMRILIIDDCNTSKRVA